jgi:hypothetical protein
MSSSWGAIERKAAFREEFYSPRLCHKNGGDLEQIKFLLGHSSIQTA